MAPAAPTKPFVLFDQFENMVSVLCHTSYLRGGTWYFGSKYLLPSAVSTQPKILYIKICTLLLLLLAVGCIGDE